MSGSGSRSATGRCVRSRATTKRATGRSSSGSEEAEGGTLDDGVAALIADRRALLLLDNLEQFVSATPDIAVVVERCPRLRIVTTSRTELRIAGAHNPRPLGGS